MLDSGINDLILSNLPLVDRIVDCYRCELRHKEDLRSAAYVELTRICNKNKDFLNLSGYINVRIRGMCRDYFRKLRQQVATVPLTEDKVGRIEGDWEVREILSTIADTDRKKQIISLREQGYLVQEIADQLGCSLTTVITTRMELKQDYLKAS